MRTGSNGIELIKHFESCRLEAFKPIPTDPWTIGWGRAHGVLEGHTCTQEQADDMLADDLKTTELRVAAEVHPKLTQNQFDACVSLAYNIGGEAFGDSTLVLKINGYRNEEAADQFLRWNKSKGQVLAGLTRRREAERKLFLTPDDEKFTL